MELSNEFVVAVGVDEAWKLLTDVERIAPCMPGAELQEVDGDDYKGIVKVKVGPITAQYKGKASFIERDDTAHKAVLRAEGRDVRGQGNANATITATLFPEGDGTKVSVVTDLAITGRAAQFGRGVMVDVSTKLMNQFVRCLEMNVLSGVAPGWATTGAAPTGNGEPVGASDAVGAMTTTEEAPAPAEPQAAAEAAPRQVSYTPAEPVDLLGTAGAPVVKRLLPAVVGAVIAWLLFRRIRGGS